MQEYRRSDKIIELKWEGFVDLAFFAFMLKYPILSEI
jgi:hypothetical protein